jgi:hypothetical protein
MRISDAGSVTLTKPDPRSTPSTRKPIEAVELEFSNPMSELAVTRARPDAPIVAVTLGPDGNKAYDVVVTF